LEGIKNQGHDAIAQKWRFRRKYRYIQDIDQRIRAMNECNDQLGYIWQRLDAFKCFDYEMEELRYEVDRMRMINPVDCSAKRSDRKITIVSERSTGCYLEAGGVSRKQLRCK